MVKESISLDEETRKVIHQITRNIEEILSKVEDANLKLDHIIETYRMERSSQRDLYDPFNGYYQQ